MTFLRHAEVSVDLNLPMYSWSLQPKLGRCYCIHRIRYPSKCYALTPSETGERSHRPFATAIPNSHLKFSSQIFIPNSHPTKIEKKISLRESMQNNFLTFQKCCTEKIFSLQKIFGKSNQHEKFHRITKISSNNENFIE